MQVTTPLVSVGGFDSVETSADPKAFVTWMSQQRQFGPDSGIIALKLNAIARAAGGPFDVATAEAITAGVITAEEGARYLQSLEDLDKRGAFCFIGASVSVRATNDSQ